MSYVELETQDRSYCRYIIIIVDKSMSLIFRQVDFKGFLTWTENIIVPLVFSGVSHRNASSSCNNVNDFMESYDYNRQFCSCSLS